MELNELKDRWQEASSLSDKKQFLSNQNIEKMIQARFRSRVSKVIFHEALGTVFAFGAVIYLIVNFSKLTTPFFQVIGVATLLMLIMLPITSLVLLSRLNSAGDLSLPYAETLKTFARQKLKFIRFQQWTVAAGYVLMVFVILLMPKFTGGRSLNDNKYFWVVAIPLGYIFVYCFSRFVLKYYSKTLQQAEELLRELEK